MTGKLNLTDLKNIIREPYVWPGGYPQFFITADGGALSVKSAKENFREIMRAWFSDDVHSVWLIVGFDVNWEDPALYCDHSGERIESAYAEDEADLPENSILLFDGCRGIYIPEAFATEIKREYVSGVSAEDWEILESGPDHEWYWETWESVLDNAIIFEPDLGQCRLHQDGDVWLIPEKE